MPRPRVPAARRCHLAGIYIKCLETGEEVAMDTDRHMDTMSVIKIPLIAEAFRQIEAGKLALGDRVTLTEAAKRPGTGIIHSLDPGVQLTVKDLLTLTIIVNDNLPPTWFSIRSAGLNRSTAWVAQLTANYFTARQ